jgi:hypothetical protein
VAGALALAATAWRRGLDNRLHIGAHGRQAQDGCDGHHHQLRAKRLNPPKRQSSSLSIEKSLVQTAIVYCKVSASFSRITGRGSAAKQP